MGRKALLDKAGRVVNGNISTVVKNFINMGSTIFWLFTKIF